MSRRAEAADRVLLAGSPGGHMELLEQLRPAVGDRPVTWATAAGARADALRRRGEAVELLPEYGRSPLRLLRNARRALSIGLRVRPRLIVTSGAGLVLPLCVIGRALGARVVFAETMARVTSRSRSGSVLARLADTVLVQWPEAARLYPRARLCRPALLEQVKAAPRRGAGTFVAVGTHSAPFDRLLREVDRAVESGLLARPVVVQSGPSSYRPRTFTPTRWMTPREVEAAAASAAVVVCHAGSGIVATALRAGRRPLVLPRLRRYGEHVDDHQEQLARKLAELGLAVALRGEIGEREVRAGEAPLAPPDGRALPPRMESVLRAELSA